MSLADLVARQGGVLSLAQAVEHGMSARTVQRHAREGSWRRLHPRVYLVGGHRLTDEARIRAAGLWAGPSAAITGPAAAHWHGMLQRAPAPIEVTVAAAAKPRPQGGVTIRRRDLALADLAVVRGLRAAARPFAVLETAVALADGSVFLDRALQQHVRFPALYRSFCRNMGRSGSSAAGRLITAAADRADSAAERLLVSLLRAAGDHRLGARPAVRAVPNRPRVPTARVAVEVEGWAWHVDAERFRADRRKGNAITRAGWDLLRFTWHDLEGRPHEVIREIQEPSPWPHDRRNRDVAATCGAHVPVPAITARSGSPSRPQ